MQGIRGVRSGVMETKTLKITLVMTLMFSFLFCGILVRPINSQPVETIFIKADGSVEGTDKIQRSGDVYTLTGNISGGIRVQKSYIVIDGAGYTVDGNGESIGINLAANYSVQPPIHVNNVTVKNLRIVNCQNGIGNENTSNNTFIGNYVADCDTGFWIIGSANNTLRHNTVTDCVTGISINYCGGGNVITENNIMSSWSVWLSPDPVVDRNYWGDYSSRFPNATEIDNSGVWNTPYSHGGTVIDYHPLVKPVDISSNGSSEVPSEQDPALPREEPFPTTLVATVFGVLIAIVGVGLLVYFKKPKR